MKPNVGKLDRVVRLMAAAALAGYGAYAYANGGTPTVYFVCFGIAVVLAVTAATRFCPAYTLIGAKTCGNCCGGGCHKGPAEG